jgi:2-dehydro-3-deoxyphosphogluconate aldolase/(4S)-4-hydroxy-2-oxoglutarate aldolase
MNTVTERIRSAGVIPVVVLESAADAAPLATALCAGGLACAEVTFRTAAAVEAIRIMAEDPDLLLGAGTVLTVQQLDQAQLAGAQFIVTPGFSPSVVRACRDRAIPIFAGVATATEIQMALDEGLQTVKFFPAEASGGVPALKALAAPFGAMSFIPTGGITAANVGSYLALRSVVAVGGSWMVAAELLRARRFNDVTRLARDAVAQVAACRQPDGVSTT